MRGTTAAGVGPPRSVASQRRRVDCPSGHALRARQRHRDLRPRDADEVLCSTSSGDARWRPSVSMRRSANDDDARWQATIVDVAVAALVDAGRLFEGGRRVRAALDRWPADSPPGCDSDPSHRAPSGPAGDGRPRSCRGDSGACACRRTTRAGRRFERCGRGRSGVKGSPAAGRLTPRWRISATYADWRESRRRRFVARSRLPRGRRQLPRLQPQPVTRIWPPR